jgi:hypothetical protein
MISEQQNGKDLVGRSYNLIWGTILVFAWRDCGKQWNNLSWDSLCPGSYANVTSRTQVRSITAWANLRYKPWTHHGEHHLEQSGWSWIINMKGSSHSLFKVLFWYLLERLRKPIKKTSIRIASVPARGTPNTFRIQITSITTGTCMVGQCYSKGQTWIKKLYTMLKNSTSR